MERQNASKMNEKFLVLADGRPGLIKAFITAPVTKYSTSFEIFRPWLRICDPTTRDTHSI